MKTIVLIIALLFSVNSAYSQTISDQSTSSRSIVQSKTIDEAKAVKIAEKFIIDNGYTDLRPTVDKKSIVIESVEWTDDVAEILKSRHNTLQKKLTES